MYEIGKVYIWQNLVGPMQHLNGTECTVLGPPMLFPGLTPGQLTDTLARDDPTLSIYAERGDLRPKNPPLGERSIMDRFKLPELETI